MGGTYTNVSLGQCWGSRARIQFKMSFFQSMSGKDIFFHWVLQNSNFAPPILRTTWLSAANHAYFVTWYIVTMFILDTKSRPFTFTTSEWQDQHPDNGAVTFASFMQKVLHIFISLGFCIMISFQDRLCDCYFKAKVKIFNWCVIFQIVLLFLSLWKVKSCTSSTFWERLWFQRRRIVT